LRHAAKDCMDALPGAGVNVSLHGKLSSGFASVTATRFRHSPHLITPKCAEEPMDSASGVNVPAELLTCCYW
jgi:hypothetical protein